MKLFTNWKKKYRAAVEDRYKEQINADYFEEKRDAMRAERDATRRLVVDILLLADNLLSGFNANMFRSLSCHLFDAHGATWIDEVEIKDTPEWLSSCDAAWDVSEARKLAIRMRRERDSAREAYASALERIEEAQTWAIQMKAERDEARKQLDIDSGATAKTIYEFIERLRSRNARIESLENEIARLRAELKAYSINSRCSDCAQKSGLMYCVGCGKPFTWRNGDKRQTYKELKDDNDRLRAERDELKRRIDALDGKCGRCGRLMSEHELDDGGDLLCPQNAHERVKCYPHPADDFVFAMPDCDVCGRPYLEHGSVDENHPGPLYKTRGHTWFNPCPADEHVKTLKQCSQCGAMTIAWQWYPGGDEIVPICSACIETLTKDCEHDLNGAIKHYNSGGDGGYHMFCMRCWKRFDFAGGLT